MAGLTNSRVLTARQASWSASIFDRKWENPPGGNDWPFSSLSPEYPMGGRTIRRLIEFS